jgi:hypothetical protein
LDQLHAIKMPKRKLRFEKLSQRRKKQHENKLRSDSWQAKMDELVWFLYHPQKVETQNENKKK